MDGSQNDTLDELYEIWRATTPDSISGDLERASALAEGANPDQREEAARYVRALLRMERWLRDR